MYSRLLLFLLLFVPCLTFSQAKEDSVQNGILKGSLLAPRSKQKIPVVLIIAGSGPTDRNGNQGNLVIPQSYKLLAESLAAQGIASLRYDKRGIGESIEENFREENYHFDDIVADAQSWVEWLSKDKRFGEIIVLGHSEGSLIGMLIAQNAKVSKYVSVAGAARRIDKVILDQFKQQKYTEKALQVAKNCFDTLASGKKLSQVPDVFQSIFRPSLQPFLISWLRYTPKDEIKKLQKPLMIVQGTSDIQVGVSEAEMLRENSPKAVYLLIEGMNHVLKDSPTNRNENLATYRKPELPLSKGLVEGIVQFIRFK